MSQRAAAFGRLCVETRVYTHEVGANQVQPPSGGCVLKPNLVKKVHQLNLAAAFGRLCVETKLALN